MKTIPCPVFKHAQNSPDNIALISGNTVLSYKKLHPKICKATIYLRSQKILPETKVALFGSNSIEYIVFLLALWRLKAVACPINSHIPRKGISHLLKQIDCRFLVDFTGTSSKIDNLTIIPVENLKDQFVADMPIDQIDLNQMATIIFTSGSTQQPKAVVHSYGNHHYNAQAANENLQLTRSDRWLLTLPLYHVGGLGILFRTFMAGTAVVMAQNRKDLIEDIKRYGISHVSLVATQLTRMIHEDGDRQALATMKAILLGGGPVPANIHRIAKENKLPVYVTYGLTECASQAATSEKPLYDLNGIKASLLQHSQIMVTKEGEICLKGLNLFQGYIKEGRLNLPLDENGWFHTGDIGKLTEGYLTVTGRKDNMFISGGENIYPEEIEAILADMPEISQAVVIPIADKEFGARPVAFIRFIGEKISGVQIKIFLAQFLPSYKIPVFFYQWPESINQGYMKIQRKIFEPFTTNGQVLP